MHVDFERELEKRAKLEREWRIEDAIRVEWLEELKALIEPVKHWKRLNRGVFKGSGWYLNPGYLRMEIARSYRREIDGVCYSGRVYVNAPDDLSPTVTLEQIELELERARARLSQESEIPVTRAWFEQLDALVGDDQKKRCQLFRGIKT